MAYRPGSDKILLSIVVFLTVFGLVMVCSASTIRAAEMDKMPYHFFVRQLVFAVAGVSALVGLMRMDYHKLQRPKVFLTILSVVGLMLVAVFFQPGRGSGGDIHRWLDLGPISIQPSEFAKLAVVLFLAWFLHDPRNDIRQPVQLLMPGVVLGFFAGLVLVGKDLGQTVMLCLVSGVLMVIAGLRWRWIGGIALLSLPAFYFWVFKVAYRWDRIETFLHPERDPQGDGYQIMQSLIAVGSGGLSGLGLGGSKQKFLFLPEAHNDFIFAVIGEEWGILGTTVVLVAFLFFFYRGMKIALNAHDRFGFYLAAGITLMVVLQGFISISMVLAMLPTKGIALPFISYGGSSLLLNLAAAGILLNLSYQNKIDEAAA
ncbi:MAG: putative lipid II flippase FtsW [Acidobacteriota bacterium]|jgi:cell division protein FtsW|nr:putative lipid II flippase FtsW [Acidobacteriota bacterium]